MSWSANDLDIWLTMRRATMRLRMRKNKRSMTNEKMKKQRIRRNSSPRLLLVSLRKEQIHLLADQSIPTLLRRPRVSSDLDLLTSLNQVVTNQRLATNIRRTAHLLSIRVRRHQFLDHDLCHLLLRLHNLRQVKARFRNRPLSSSVSPHPSSQIFNPRHQIPAPQ